MSDKILPEITEAAFGIVKSKIPGDTRERMTLVERGELVYKEAQALLQANHAKVKVADSLEQKIKRIEDALKFCEGRTDIHLLDACIDASEAEEVLRWVLAVLKDEDAGNTY